MIANCTQCTIMYMYRSRPVNSSEPSLKVSGLTLYLYPSAGHERFLRDMAFRNSTLQGTSCRPIPVQSCCGSAELVANRGWPLPSSYNCPLHQDTQEHDLETHNLMLRYPCDVVVRSCGLQVPSCNPIPVQSCCASAKLLVNSRGWPLPSSYNCPLHQDTQEHDLGTHNLVLTCLHDVVFRSCTLEIASCEPIPVQSCCASAELLVSSRGWPLPSAYNCPLHQDTQEHDIVTHTVVLRKGSQ